MKNLITRTLSGIVFLVVLIGSILWSQYAFIGLFLIISLLGLNEYFSMVNRFEGVNIDKLFGLLCGGLMFLLFASVVTGLAEPKVLLIGVFLLMAPFTYELIRKESNPFPNSSYFVLGLVYVIISFSMLGFLGNYKVIPGEYNPMVVLGYFILVWSYDVFAYVVGSLIGRRKLFRQISPGKTWEGTLGGALIT
ncbi:MAG: phosphatidate cytidylyltransferase, partial [Bacteroidales bacterium]|nr:phosphatidate cytidylyltransferase [Bacteroidales bacterium]MCF8377508.1 phosphatidate cytidylyltransferase [Bacteroidales bacterium]MCF8401631.1 phosphatidate cytidylyltransferase [Bacteroidales bacterium]